MTESDLIEQRIQYVETGLIPNHALGEPGSERLSLIERMADYNVPGVSLAVINDYAVEWARGYGAREAGKPEHF